MPVVPKRTEKRQDLASVELAIMHRLAGAQSEVLI